MTAFDDLLINGTSLKTYGYITSFDGIFSEGPLRGDNVKLPGRPGAVHTTKVRDSYVFTVPLVIVGNWAVVNQAISDLRTLLNSATSALTMTRKRSLTSGNLTQTASGDYLAGLEPGLVGMGAGRVAIDLVNLDGGWT